VAVAFFAASLFVAWIGNRLGGHGNGVGRDRVAV